ncbi:YdeI/OmpD-associated family protein [Hamadaea tsunoensis]|uniref:YdeI/OmpD-associated family protein n=1 Tax=Hamadaea tsunoensis TaxID=53368 RepID=UPI0004892F11|nr:YdeI/OmpD-associated family protein [Hamadaea tsunoensis]
MSVKNANENVTRYIEGSAEFAKPILGHIREVVHGNCPDVVESIKWGLPHFEYAGDLLCVISSARDHCSLTFIKSEFMTDPRFAGGKKVKPDQRFMGRLKSLADLPSDEELAGFIKEAMDLNDRGVKLDKTAKAAPGSKPEPPTPDYLLEALSANEAARQVFEKAAPSFRTGYVEWLESAKTDATRQKRMAEALEWIAEGKGRFWKYQK